MLNNRNWPRLLLFACLLVLWNPACGFAQAAQQGTELQQAKERLEATLAQRISESAQAIQKCDARIAAASAIVDKARVTGNAAAESVAREAMQKSRAAKSGFLEQQRKDQELQRRLAALFAENSGTGARDLEAALEQFEFDNMNAAWMSAQRQRFQQRTEQPNKWASSISASLTTKAPPLPWKEYQELQPGDVLLISGKAIATADNLLSGGNASGAAHTVLFLREVGGKKLFLDNQPGQGPHIITGDMFLDRYRERGGDVASLAQPLNDREAQQLFKAAIDMTQHNNQALLDRLPGTDYGVWGKKNVVCSEADWALLKAAGRDIAATDDRVKLALGIDFSPADFYNNNQYFLVSPLGGLPPAKPTTN